MPEINIILYVNHILIKERTFRMRTARKMTEAWEWIPTSELQGRQSKTRKERRGFQTPPQQEAPDVGEKIR